MTRLHTDFETASELDLSLVGLDNYLAHPSTRVVLQAWAIDDGKVRLWQPHREERPRELREVEQDPFVVKCAWNAGFERNVYSRLLSTEIPIEEWLDPMIWCRHLSTPGYLEDAGRIIGIRQDQAKLEEGAALLKMFSEPVKSENTSPLFGKTAAVFRDERTDPEAWQRFCEYCRQDVVAERAIYKKVLKFPLPEVEQRGWVLDQIINQRGMPVDMPLVLGAGAVADQAKEDLRRQLKEITQLENPNSRDQMLEWLRGLGYPFNGLGKAFVERALGGEGTLSPLGREVLRLRKQASKTSDSKFERIRDVVSPDARLRHQYAFHGAPRTARWAGKDVQLQNMPRPTKEVEKRLERAIALLTAGDYLGVCLEFSSPMDVVSSCIRSVFKAPPGKKFVVCDLNAIENRGLGWLARCDSILKVFRENLDPYLSFGALMYKIPYADLIKIDPASGKHKAKDAKAAEIRQNSKPAVLGAGYRLGGGDQVENAEGDITYTGLWGYAKAMGIDMPKELAHESVKIFREAYPEVVQLWYDLENASFAAVRTGEPQTVGPVTFRCYGKKLLRIELPSGHVLSYIHPKLEMREFYGQQKKTLTYEGVDQVTKQWGRTQTHGGKLTENIVQAVSRDVLLDSMFRTHDAGFEIVGHCHDEIIALVPEDSPLGLVQLRQCMIQSPAWAPDFPLDAEGYEGIYYRKG